MLIALTRPVPQSIAQCELTHLERRPIDFERAALQHAEYEALLATLGCTVYQLPGLETHPDSVFIEDTAVVLDECAIITRPGAESRRGEVDGVADALRPHRQIHTIEGPGTLDGGDVLRAGKKLFVGTSSRSNSEGCRQLADAVRDFGYTVTRVRMHDSLHLKTVASALPDGSLLLDASRVDADAFGLARWIDIEADEPEGANVLVVSDTIVCPASAPRTQAALEERGYRTIAIDASELAKAEGGLTCCSLLVSA